MSADLDATYGPAGLALHPQRDSLNHWPVTSLDLPSHPVETAA